MDAQGSPTHSPARDSLGCSVTGLDEDGELAATDVRFHRKRKADAQLMQVVTPASDRGILVGVSMTAGHQRHIMQDGRSSRHSFEAGGIYLRDFAVDYKADLAGAFDFVLMELAPAAFERSLADLRGGSFRGLRSVAGERDEVLFHLARTVGAAMARPQETSPLFLEQMGFAITTHLAHRYAGTSLAQRPGRARLSRAQEARAKEMLRSRLDGTMPIAEIAAACQVSEGHFIRAFRETTGKSPLQWLLAERLNTARGLLLESHLPLAEIAHTCGFADQSHFTRVFTRFEGRPPGAWRRETRAC